VPLLLGRQTLSKTFCFAVLLLNFLTSRLQFRSQLSGAQSKVYQKLYSRVSSETDSDLLSTHPLNFTGFNKCNTCPRFSTFVVLESPSFENRTSYRKSKIVAWEPDDSPKFSQIWYSSVHQIWDYRAHWGPLKTGRENVLIINNSDVHCQAVLKFGRRCPVVKTKNHWRGGRLQVAMRR